MCSCPLTTTKNFVTCSFSSTTISFCSTVRRWPCARTRARWALVRTGNISLGVLPGGGDRASSTSGRSDILFCRLDGGSRVSFMQTSLLRLVDEGDQFRHDLLRRFFHKSMACAFDDNSVGVRIDHPCLRNQEFS